MSNLFAYSVQSMDDRTGGIVFAPSESAALLEGAARFHDGEDDDLNVQRLPWADSYLPGPVPFQAMFNQGWWQECQGCGQRIANGECDRNDRLIRFNIVEDTYGVFCRPSCHYRYVSRRRTIKAGEKRAIAMLEKYIVSRLGKVEFTDDHHAYVERLGHKTMVKQVIVRFKVPGLKYGSVSCRLEHQAHVPMTPIQPLFYVASADADYFKAWREQRLLDLRAERGDVLPLTDRQKYLIRHALGLPTDRRRSFRNRFTAHAGTTNHVDWMELKALGLAYHAPAGTEGGLDWFYVTRAGARAALEAREKLCPEDFPPIL